MGRKKEGEKESRPPPARRGEQSPLTLKPHPPTRGRPRGGKEGNFLRHWIKLIIALLPSSLPWLRGRKNAGRRKKKMAGCIMHACGVAAGRWYSTVRTVRRRTFGRGEERILLLLLPLVLAGDPLCAAGGSTTVLGSTAHAGKKGGGRRQRGGGVKRRSGH